VETAFEKAHPEIDLHMEYHGSIQVMRHASELNEPIDVVLSADQALIPMLMYTKTMPDTDIPYANWNIKFATNQMALAYTAKSKYADEITADNWYEILSRDDVRIGLPDPRFDASGYRTLMLIKLAEKYYQKEGIFSDIYGGQFTTPMRDLDRPELTTILVPEILETKTDSKIYLRGSSIQLLSLLESGDIDYAFEYQSVIEQHKLNEVVMPGQINMGDPEYLPEYQKVMVRLDFQRFATVKPEFKGEVITYGLTIPANAPNPDLAVEYIQFLLSEEGRAIMEAQHHPLLDTIVVDQPDNLPEGLKSIIPPEG
jgi:molybdate/tungstate transport system substrate-binding protein